jgi:hypothetical protein
MSELTGWREAAQSGIVWFVLLGRAIWVALCVFLGASDIPLSIVVPAAVTGTLVATLVALRLTGGRRFSLLELRDDHSLT